MQVMDLLHSDLSGDLRWGEESSTAFFVPI